MAVTDVAGLASPSDVGDAELRRRQLERFVAEMPAGLMNALAEMIYQQGLRLPLGAIIQYSALVAPDGWLLCDGSAVSRATYADLFGLIGTTYGVGDGSTTFNVPNIKGRMPVGYDASQSEFNALGETGGAKTHTLTEAEMPSHTHGFNPGEHYHNMGASFSPTNNVASGSAFKSGTNQTTSGAISWSGASIDATGGGGAHNNLPPYIALPFIIKHYPA